MPMNKIVSRLSLILIVAELLLVLLSWLLSATMTDDVRSLLSSEGLRWFFGQFTTVMLKPQLIWLLLLAMAGGCLWRSTMFWPSRSPFRSVFALRVSLVVLLIMIAGVTLLVILPHSDLLSATGHLWPSPFSSALVPVVACLAIVSSACYGLLTRSFASVTDVFASLSWGVQQLAPFLVLYVFAVQFYASCRYVFVTPY